MDESRAEKTARAVVQAARAAGADEAEVHLGGSREALTRFAANEIHQNVQSETWTASVRATIGKRSARTDSTKLDAKGLEALVARTLEVVQLTPEDPGLLPVVSPEELPELRRLAAGPPSVDRKTADSTPEARAETVKRVLDAVKSAGFEAAGYLSTSRGGSGWETDTICYANSRDVRHHFERTYAAFSLTVQAKDSSGWAEAFSPRLGDLDVDRLAARAIEKARASASPIDVEPGAYDVILEPAAVQSLTEFLGWGGFSGNAYEEGSVWSSGKLGERVFGKNVTIRDDWSDPRNPGPPFDEEGAPRKKLALVTEGVLTGLAWDRRSAKRHGTITTGHGFRVPSTYGSGPSHVIVDGGKDSLESMIASTKRGILVTRFWYNRLVDPKREIVTGMTRDGTFLVEDGKVQRGIKNMRFNQSVIEMLNNVAMLGPVDPSYMVPAMKIAGFTFSSKTKF